MRGWKAGHAYAWMSVIEALEALTPADRIGHRLAEQPLGASEFAYLDLELWHRGSREACQAVIAEIMGLLLGLTSAGERSDRQLKVTDQWIGNSVCVARVRVNEAAVNALLHLNSVKELDRRQVSGFELAALSHLGLADFTVEPEAETAARDLIGVLIIDSGVMTGHPLLRGSVVDAKAFPAHLDQQGHGAPDDGDTVQGGHGTAVAGIAVYHDVESCIASREFAPSSRLYSARVTNEFNEYDEEELLEHQLEDAVRYFLDNYDEIRVINISLGDHTTPYDDGKYQFRVAAALDAAGVSVPR